MMSQVGYLKTFVRDASEEQLSPSADTVTLFFVGVTGTQPADFWNTHASAGVSECQVVSTGVSWCQPASASVSRCQLVSIDVS